MNTSQKAATSAFSTTAGSDLDAVISDLPWEDAFALGKGVDAITGKVVASALEATGEKPATVKSSEESIRWIETTEDIEREISVSASGKYNIGTTSVEASLEYLGNVKLSERTQTLIAEWSLEYTDYDLGGPWAFTPAAAGLLATPTQFRAAFGDYFVAGRRRAAVFYATYVCEAKSKETLQSFKTSVGGSADMFTAKGSAAFMEAVSKSEISLSTYVSMSGYEGDAPSTTGLTPEGVLEVFNWFKTHATGEPREALLNHYNTLDPTYPRSVDIAASVFVELAALYRSVWTCRLASKACPAAYQDEMNRQFQALSTGVEANHSALATDAALRAGYQEQATALERALGDLADRLAFYEQVLAAVAKEPANGSKIEEGKGTQEWPYGYELWPASTAVTIQSWYSHYKKGADVAGHREHNFNFGPDQDKLVVGWKMKSNRSDALNGWWWKTKDTILGTDSLAVHIKGDYARDTDWACYVYYVNKADYLF